MHTWNSSQMHLVPLIMVFTILATGLPTTIFLSYRTAPHVVTCGLGVASLPLWWILYLGLWHILLPPLSYTSSLQFFLALHLATVNSLSPALPVLNTLLLAPYPDGKVLTTSSNCRPSMDTNSCISSDPLEYPLAFLQSQAIATYTCHTYLADICRYTTFCISKRWQSFQGFDVWHQTWHRNSLSMLPSHHHGTPLPNQGQVSSSP